jgi:hypothetical protein
VSDSASDAWGATAGHRPFQGDAVGGARPQAAVYGAQLLVGLGFHQNTTSHVWAAVEAAMLKV